MADVIEYLDKPVEEILDNWNFRHKLQHRILDLIAQTPMGTGTITSVNGQTGPVVTLTTTNIPEGTNLYFTTARSRLAISGGTGISYDNVTGIITNTGVITETDPIFTASDAFGIDSTDISNWTTAYNDKINSAAFTGTTTKTLTLTQQDGGTVTASFTDLQGVTSVNGNSGPAVSLDSDDIPEGSTNIYYHLATVQADILTSAVTNGDTTHAPTSDAVFDAIAALTTGVSDVNGQTGSVTLGIQDIFDYGDVASPGASLTMPTGGITLYDGSISARLHQWSNTSNVHIVSVNGAGITTSRIVNFPDKNGTFAYTSDLVTPSWQDVVDVSEYISKDLFVSQGAFRTFRVNSAGKEYLLGDVDGLSGGTNLYLDDTALTATIAARNGVKIPFLDPSTGAYKVLVRDDSDNIVRWTTISAGSGTVTSVGLTGNSLFNITGSPVTTSGNIDIDFDSQSQNLVLASPDGTSGLPTFRSLVIGDLPSLTTTIRAALSGTNGVSYNSGTGVIQMDTSYTGNFTFNGRLTNINTGSTVAFVAVGSTSTFSVGMGSTASSGFIQGYNGSGVSAARFLQINPSGGNVMIGTGSDGGEKFQVVGTVALDIGSDATGDIYYRNSSGTFTRLAIGSAGNALVVSGASLPSWAALTSSNISGFNASVTGLFSESGNELTYSSGVYATNKAVQSLTDAATVTFNVANGYNATVTLGGNRTLSITNPIAGEYYTLKVIQGAPGSRTLAMPAGTKVANAGGGVVTLTPTSGAIDILTFWYDGTNYFVNKGANYT